MIIIAGNISKAAETRTVKVKGVDTLVTDFNVAENIGFGENKRTNFYRVTVWRDRGAKLAPHCMVGRPVYIEGNISARGWTDKNGQAQAQLEVTNPTTIRFLTKKPGDPEDLPFAEEAEEA